MPLTKLNTILDDLKGIQDRDERMEFLIECAEQFQEVPEHVATRPFPESARVPACQSEVFAFATPAENGNLDFYFAVENPQGISAKAMATILTLGLSGLNAQDIANVPSEIVYDIFGPDIGMGKGQGLRSMVFMLQALAKQNQR